MLHYLFFGAAVLGGLVVWLALTGLTGYAGTMLVGHDESYRWRWHRFELWRWACAVLLWLLAGGIFFGGIGYVADRMSKDCADKGGHLVTRGKVTTCVVDVYEQPR